MLETPGKMNEKKLENKKSPSSIFNFKPNISKNTEDIEVGGDSSNTLTHIYQTIQKTLLLTKQPSIQELNEKDNDNKYKEIPKKGRVSFKEPFTNIVEVESLKEFNLKMTYNDYDEGGDEVLLSNKECCNKIRCLIF